MTKKTKKGEMVTTNGRQYNTKNIELSRGMDEPLVPRAPRNDRPIRGEDLYGPLRETSPEKTNGDPSGI